MIHTYERFWKLSNVNLKLCPVKVLCRLRCLTTSQKGRHGYSKKPLHLPGGEFSCWNLKRVVDNAGGGMSESTRVWTAKARKLYFHQLACPQMLARLWTVGEKSPGRIWEPNPGASCREAPLVTAPPCRPISKVNNSKKRPPARFHHEMSSARFYFNHDDDPLSVLEA